MDGADLFGIVAAYAALGDHRTGTAADAATIEWFADELSDRGGTVAVEPFGFLRYDAHWRVTVDGAEVAALPLFYSGVGSVRTQTPAAGRVLRSGRGVVGLAEVVAKAVTDGHEIAVVAITGTSRLTAINRPIGAADGLPVIVVTDDHDLDRAALDVSFDAACVDGRSANVVAGFGGATPSAPGLLVSSPLSGWFRCAGERGTGVAVLLSLIESLADAGPLTVVGTSGHELDTEGLRQLLATRTFDPLAVVHLGASIAARGDDEGIAPAFIRHSATGAADDALRRALAPIGRRVEAVDRDRCGEATSWIGEARRWCATGAPMLSMTGGSPLFHTPADLPDAATSPELLSLAAHATRHAVTVLRDAAMVRQ